MHKIDTISPKWPKLMVFTRFSLALVLQLLFAALYFLAGYPKPIEAADYWFTIQGTLIGTGCLVLIMSLIRRENLTLLDLVNIKDHPFAKIALKST